MEFKKFPNLREHLEYSFGVETHGLKSMTQAGRNLEEEIERFTIPFQEIIRYGITGQIKQHFFAQGYKIKAVNSSGDLTFKRNKDLLTVNVTYSDSTIRVSVIDLRK